MARLVDVVIDELVNSPIAEANAIGDVLLSVRQGGGRLQEITLTLQTFLDIAKSVKRDIKSPLDWEPPRR